MIDKKFTSALILLFVLASFFSISAEDYSDWQYSKQVYINTSALGLYSDVSNFPLLIRLNSSNFNFSEAQSDGDDIRFSQSDGTTPLDYEKEVWDNTGQVGEIWIKIPTVLANNSEQSIIMYWGNANASNASYGPNVFARSNDFTCVYHMTDKDDLDDASATPSTGEYDGSSNGTQNVNGIAGKAVDFEGADWIDIPSGIFSSISEQVTIELWQYGDACQPQADRILWGSDYYGNRAINIVLPWSDEYIVWDAGNSGGCFNRIEKYATGTSEYKGQWNHWVFTKNTGDGSMRMYLNGEEWLGESSGNTYTIQVNNVRIGADHYGCQNYDGYIDEFRFSKTVRSTSWIKLSYETQREDQVVITFDKSYSCPMNACDGDNVRISNDMRIINDSGKKVASLYNDEKEYDVPRAKLSMYHHENEKIRLFTDPLSPSWIDAGNFGLGTNQPEAKLDVAGAIRSSGQEEGTILYARTNESGTPTGDGFRIRYEEDFIGENRDVLVFEKTDNNNLHSEGPEYGPDGGIAFVNTDKLGVSETAMYIRGDNKIGIGKTDPSTELDVNGDITATNVIADQFKVGEWVIKEAPDYIFGKNYSLPSLEKVEKYVKTKKHLPEVKSAKEMEREGIDLVDMNMVLLREVEKLYLYIMEQSKKIEKLSEEVDALKR